jgi:SSS family solute:Na+ symporter/sodium/pantothenate symporter
VAGLILAAPYGAVLSTVSGWLLIVSSGLVRDIYQRFLRPAASEREIARASYSATIAIGLIAAIIALRPPKYLQLIIVFSSTGMASAFLVPALLGSFWRKASAAGAIAAMATGTSVTLGLYLLGTVGPARLHLDWLFGPNPPIGASGTFRPYYLLGFDPCIWGLSSSLLAGLLVSAFTAPPSPERISLLFDVQPPDAPAPATLELHPELRPGAES